MSSTTASMQQFGAPSGPDSARKGGTSAGLVLLYAPSYAQLHPAYPLIRREICIGREPSCEITILDRAVSRRHACLEYREDSWVLRDMGGANGTIVDGRFIDEVELEHGQELRVGDAVFLFVAMGAEKYLPYRIDGEMAGGARRLSSRMTELVGGMQMDRLGAQLERIAPVELSVIVEGESGTGKELVAREIHRLSMRKGPLQAINCAAIPANLIESELFGCRRGAFSGADRDRVGIIAAANGGTLLLDELGDMPLEAQAKLLRVIQTREVYPVGSTTGHHVDVRLVCATNRDLKRLVQEGKFRGDLHARLNEFSVCLPPLRERKEDIFLLSKTLLARNGSAHKQLSFAFVLALLHYDWPYNVRELEACLKRASAVCETDVLDPRHLPATISEVMATYGSRAELHQPVAVQTAPQSPIPARGRTAFRPSEEQLRHLLSQHRGNIAAVGRELGKERMQIHRWMQRYGIVADEYRS